MVQFLVTSYFYTLLHPWTVIGISLLSMMRLCCSFLLRLGFHLKVHANVIRIGDLKKGLSISDNIHTSQQKFNKAQNYDKMWRGKKKIISYSPLYSEMDCPIFWEKMRVHLEHPFSSILKQKSRLICLFFFSFSFLQ